MQETLTVIELEALQGGDHPLVEVLPGEPDGVLLTTGNLSEGKKALIITSSGR